MNGWPKEVTLNIIKTKITDIHNSYEEFKKASISMEKEALEFLESLIEQIPNATSGPLIPKTPKVPRKRELKRIQTIPEDDVMTGDSKTSETWSEISRMSEQTYDDVPPARMRRAASQKAAQSIKDQQALGIGSKLRRPSTEDTTINQTKVHSSRPKRNKSADSSDEEFTQRPKKFSKTKSKSQQDNEETRQLETLKLEPDSTSDGKFLNDKGLVTRETSVRTSRVKRQREKSEETLSRQNSRGSGKAWTEPAAKKANVAENHVAESDVTMEASLYEDAIGKSIPMNSTMNPNTTVTIDRKIMDVTVVLDQMKMPLKMNETVTLQKKQTPNSPDANATLVNEEPPITEKTFPLSPRKTQLQNRINPFREAFVNPEFDALITDDESSPEKEDKRNKGTNMESRNKETKRFTRSSLLTEDDDVCEVAGTPPPRAKTVLRDANGLKKLKSAFKPNPLFSPYSKESVKKRVEAFEQAGLNSPKTVEIDAPTRLTRTKTRALAAAASETQFTQTGLTVAQKAARKSLSRAKEIAKMKERKENEEFKENNILNSAQKTSRLLAPGEKMALKQAQRTTPVSKSRLQMPMSVNRIQHTPAGPQIVNQVKALTATKSNIVTSVDSFIQPARMLTKSNSNDNLAEKRRKVNDEDAKRKREETLKAMSEEKRRKREEKELKNKLAREAKERLEMERRLKQEREREEKAKAALLLQEKQREETERKRLLQLQRAQEKEERRKQEEQLRLLRLQEQEEAERQLAEQKRREQEAERRKIAELRAQQAAAAEAARLKAQYIAKAKQAKQHHDANSYQLDSSDPDEETDDESRPKHAIPYWAQESVRATQLAIQRYIPMKAVLVFFGTKKCTPDLTQMFKGIRKERLQRTSSAIWKTPPRYSMMMND